MDTSNLSEMIQFFSSRWNELKNKEKQIRNILLTNNNFALIGSAFVTNALRSLEIDPTSTTALIEKLQEVDQQHRLLLALQTEAARVERSLQQTNGFILRQPSAQKTIEGDEKTPTAEPYVDYSPFPLEVVGEETCI